MEIDVWQCFLLALLVSIADVKASVSLDMSWVETDTSLPCHHWSVYTNSLANQCYNCVFKSHVYNNYKQQECMANSQYLGEAVYGEVNFESDPEATPSCNLGPLESEEVIAKCTYNAIPVGPSKVPVALPGAVCSFHCREGYVALLQNVTSINCHKCTEKGVPCEWNYTLPDKLCQLVPLTVDRGDGVYWETVYLMTGVGLSVLLIALFIISISYRHCVFKWCTRPLTVEAEQVHGQGTHPELCERLLTGEVAGSPDEEKVEGEQCTSVDSHNSNESGYTSVSDGRPVSTINNYQYISQNIITHQSIVQRFNNLQQNVTHINNYDQSVCLEVNGNVNAVNINHSTTNNSIQGQVQSAKKLTNSLPAERVEHVQLENCAVVEPEEKGTAECSDDGKRCSINSTSPVCDHDLNGIASLRPAEESVEEATQQKTSQPANEHAELDTPSTADETSAECDSQPITVLPKMVPLAQRVNSRLVTADSGIATGPIEHMMPSMPPAHGLQFPVHITGPARAFNDSQLLPGDCQSSNLDAVSLVGTPAIAVHEIRCQPIKFEEGACESDSGESLDLELASLKDSDTRLQPEGTSNRPSAPRETPLTLTSDCGQSTDDLLLSELTSSDLQSNWRSGQHRMGKPHEQECSEGLTEISHSHSANMLTENPPYLTLNTHNSSPPRYTDHPRPNIQPPSYGHSPSPYDRDPRYLPPGATPYYPGYAPEGYQPCLRTQTSFHQPLRHERVGVAQRHHMGQAQLRVDDQNIPLPNVTTHGRPSSSAGDLKISCKNINELVHKKQRTVRGNQNEASALIRETSLFPQQGAVHVDCEAIGRVHSETFDNVNADPLQGQPANASQHSDSEGPVDGKH